MMLHKGFRVMRSLCHFTALVFLLFVFLNHQAGVTPFHSATAPADSSWYFAVSGDSRDCGDLIMPRIARAIADQASTAPISFYWHLGDFRALYRVDCDIAKRNNAKFRCVKRDPSPDQTKGQKSAYLETAWDDFINQQLSPFRKNKIAVFLGIGNHELLENHNRDRYREKFGEWLKQDAIEAQRKLDRTRQIKSSSGDTFYHFVQNGVDFIYLDNAEHYAFFQKEIDWLFRVLEEDAKHDAVKTIIVGMHEALPGSTSMNHAMDDGKCADICQADHVYERLYEARNLNGPPAKQKHVYLLASHSHFFRENIYQTPAHENRVLQGWLVGTAGAEQYQTKIQYGYLLVEVRSDGTLSAEFKEVGKDSPSVNQDPDGPELIEYCFGNNWVPAPSPTPKNCQKC
jgi:hypothetical protein